MSGDEHRTVAEWHRGRINDELAALHSDPDVNDSEYRDILDAIISSCRAARRTVT